MTSLVFLGGLGIAQAWAQSSSFTLTLREDEFETLGDLKPAYIDFSFKAVPNVSLDEIVRRYVALIKSASDAELRVKALHRLAALDPLLTDSSQALIDDELWRIAIQSYEEALKSNPGRADADELRYQLARAHEMRGDQAASLEQLQQLVKSHPRSRHYLEAQFRVAELQYGFGRYHEAEQAYGVLLKPGVNSAYSSKAQYMLGWALYKQDKLDQALDQYLMVLDTFHGTGGELGRIEQDLVDDTLRIMSIIFSFRQGAETLANLIARHDRHRYAPMLYEHLVEHYLERERYQDAAATTADFLQKYPKAPEAPSFAIRRIHAYQQGGFDSQVWPEKERFVANFGIYSAFWKSSNPEARATWEPQLRQYLQELARRYYVTAQKAKAGENKQWYRGAASYLQHYVEAFPADEASGENYFLLGEALFNLGDYPAAAEAYSHAAYGYLNFAKRPEAAYAAIVAYVRQIEVATEQEQTVWRGRRLDSLIRFADTFPEDARATRLTVLAANEQLAFGKASEALALARKVTESKQSVKREVLRGAWLAEAESAFALHLYVEAEHGFQQALALWPQGDKRRADLKEKMAAAVYKQAELSLAQDRTDVAIEHFLRVGEVAPDSALRVNAHYDAAMKLLELEQWARAIEVMQAFSKNYPSHELAREIPDKLVFAYEQNGQPAEAAGVLLNIAEQDSDAERRRKALFQGAELLEQAGRTKAALEAYARYASRYPRPLDTSLEVHRKLADIHGMRQEFKQRNRWLNAIIKLDREAGRERTERSRYLAAEASWRLSQDEKLRFDAIKLTLPLKASLARKRQAMEQLMSWLKRTNDYGIGEFATAATHLSGEVYRQLARDLMASDRPRKLNELELEQYNVLLEEQAFPFEEKAIEFFELNTRRAKDGIYDKWVQESYRALGTMVPARYDKKEMRIDVVSQLR